MINDYRGNGCTINSPRAVAIREELGTLRDNYKIDHDILNKIGKMYMDDATFKLGDPTKIVKYIEYVLKGYGYTQEEMAAFIKRNRRIMFSRYADFVARLRIFNHFNMFDEVFFTYYDALTTESSVGTRSIYAILCGNPTIKSVSEFKEIARNISASELKHLLTEYPLSQEVLTEIQSELNESLKSRMREVSKLKRTE